MAKAEDEVKQVYPKARVVRSTFGLIVLGDDHGTRLGDGRSHYEEEAWLSAVDYVLDPVRKDEETR